jgi:hypothetical protein
MHRPLIGIELQEHIEELIDGAADVSRPCPAALLCFPIYGSLFLCGGIGVAGASHRHHFLDVAVTAPPPHGRYQQTFGFEKQARPHAIAHTGPTLAETMFEEGDFALSCRS